mmetsp:Transcript_11458/g.25977  ORF Transcript_11458/g.25977 Transcript_11458/m.25977 type:complete len:191 (-) Transcript_11458:26-598(-)
MVAGGGHSPREAEDLRAELSRLDFQLAEATARLQSQREAFASEVRLCDSRRQEHAKVVQAAFSELSEERSRMESLNEQLGVRQEAINGLEGEIDTVQRQQAEHNEAASEQLASRRAMWQSEMSELIAASAEMERYSALQVAARTAAAVGQGQASEATQAQLKVARSRRDAALEMHAALQELAALASHPSL